MKRRTEIILIGVVVLAGLAALSSVKRGGRGEAGKCGGGGACCPMMSGMNLWPTSLPAGTNVANTNSALTGGESTTNRAQ